MPRPGPRRPPQDYNAGQTLNVRQTARMLGVHENTVRNWATEGRLTDVRIPGTRYNRFLRTEVEALLRNRRAATGRHPRVELDAGSIQPGDPFYLFFARRGEVWHWQPALPHASELVTVVRCWWNGEEWWVRTRNSDGKECSNELYHFLQSAVLVEPGAADA